MATGRWSRSATRGCPGAPPPRSTERAGTTTSGGSRRRLRERTPDPPGWPPARPGPAGPGPRAGGRARPSAVEPARLVGDLVARLARPRRGNALALVLLRLLDEPPLAEV